MIDCVRGALQLGVNPNSRKYQLGPIRLTSLYSHRHASDDERRDLRYRITKLLIDSGSQVSRANSNIFSAVSDGDENLIRLLLENGENVLRKISRQSLTHWAAHYDRPKSMEMLNEFGAPALSVSEQAQQRISNIPPLGDAGSGILVVEDALKRGARINGTDARGLTPLGAAVDRAVVEKNHLDLIVYLLEKGANPNAKYSVHFRYGESDHIVERSLPLNQFVMSSSPTMNVPKEKKIAKSRLYSKFFALGAMGALISKGAKIAGKDSIGRKLNASGSISTSVQYRGSRTHLKIRFAFTS